MAESITSEIRFTCRPMNPPGGEGGEGEKGGGAAIPAMPFAAIPHSRFQTNFLNNMVDNA